MVRLKRELGLLSAVGIGIGAVIGAGIFVVTGIAAEVAGAGMLVGLIIAGLAATFNGLSAAQLAAVYPQAGGTYEYGYRTLSPILGFSAGWMFLASKLAAGGLVVLGLASSLSRLLPFIPQTAGIIGVTLLVTLANYFGISKAGKINLIIVGVTVLALLYFVISGIPSFDLNNLSPFAPKGFMGIAESAALMFFAYTGYARITTLGEEVKDPRKVIPRAIIITIIVSIILYSVIALIALGAVGALPLSISISPLSFAAAKFGTPFLTHCIDIAAVTAMVGVLMSQVLGISRMFFAMSRKSDLTSVFSQIHPNYHIPHVGVLFSGVIILLIGLTGSLSFIASTASFSILLYYSITNLAAIRMKKNDKLYPTWVSLLGLISCLAMAFSLKLETILTGVLLLGTGLILRFLFKGSVQKT